MSAEALLPIERADADLADAREILRACLEQDDAAAARRVYRALRLWTWKALTGRRFDDEIRGWMDLLAAVEARLADSLPQLAARVAVLADLLEDSVRFADANPDAGLLQRSHVRGLLCTLRDRGGTMLRTELVADLRVGQATLTQLLNVLAARGKVEREQVGRQIRVSLTVAGRALADEMGPQVAGAAQSAEPLPPPPPSRAAEHDPVFRPAQMRSADPLPADEATTRLSRVVMKAAARIGANAQGPASADPPPPPPRSLRYDPTPRADLPPLPDRQMEPQPAQLRRSADQASRAFHEERGYERTTELA